MCGDIELPSAYDDLEIWSHEGRMYTFICIISVFLRLSERFIFYL